MIITRFAYLLLCVLTLTVNSVIADSPLPGIIAYKQKLKVKCKNAEDAKNLSLTPMKLPANKKLAFSARWDDSNLQHLKTHKIMSKNGIKGTFYLNGWGNPKYGTAFCEKLLKNGSSIGAHSKTHKSLPSLNANEMFYEVLSVRLMLEDDSNTPVSTMVLPFCRFGNSGDRQIQLDLGKAMMNSGFIGAPEIYYGRYEGYVGYPKNTLADTGLIRAGDRNLNYEKFHNNIKRYLSLGGKFERNPCIAVGIHSWHTPDGMKTLDKVLAEISNNKDWWYCNQNEYAAYRFEANQCKIEKTIKGADVEFTITRYTPESLGANIDLWFMINGVKSDPEVISPDLAEIKGGSLRLPHSKDQKLPSVIAVTSGKGESNKIPFVKCNFKVSDANIAELKVSNNGSVEMKDVTLTLRSGPGYTPGVIVDKVDSIPAEANVSKSWTLAHHDALRYELGKPYFVAQIDFTVDQKRYRLYSEYREENISNQPVVPSTVVQGFVQTDEVVDYSELSKPQTNISSLKLKKLEAKNPLEMSKDAIAFKVSKEDKHKLSAGFMAIAVLEFIPEKAGEMFMKTRAEALFLNGKEVLKDSDKKWVLPVVAGKNRLILVLKYKGVDKLQTCYLFRSGVEVKELCRISD